MTLDEIFQKEEISARSINLCSNNGLNDLDSLLNYFREYKTFARLRNCGSKSDNELCKLCLKYLNEVSVIDFENTERKKSLSEIISNLDSDKINLVNSFIEINTNKLSNRAKNSLTNYLNKDLTIDNIYKKIITNERFDYKDIRSVGFLTAKELEKFINSITVFIDKVNTYEKINTDEIKATLQHENAHIDLSEINLDPVIVLDESFSLPIEVINQNSIFKTIDYLINNSTLFDRNCDFVFLNTFKVYHNQKGLTLLEIAENLTISRERVRQIRNDCFNMLFKKLKFIQAINEDLYQRYNIDITSEYVVIDNEKRDLINSYNQTNFSKEFISIILYIYKSEKFAIVGEPEDVLLFKSFNSQNRHNWDNLYLVSKNLSEQFRFTAYANDINNRLSERINETYRFNFLGYLFNFLKTSDHSLLAVIQPIAELVLNNEFELFIDTDDNIVFQRNTLKQVHEYVVEALEKLGEPSKIEDIYNLMIAEHPEITKSAMGLRGSLPRSNEIIYFGRSSTYGLKKWEFEKVGVKGGTIKDIIIDILRDKKQPIHISIILEYLKGYRGERDERSVITNLKADPMKRFIVYNQGFVGLSENYNSYSKKYEQLTTVLGKTIISKYRKGYTKSEINAYLQANYDLTRDESNLVMDNLKYFNEN